MKIQGFNPQITKEQFTEALKTKSGDELKSLVFAALSNNSLSQLTEGLEAHTVKQIEDLAAERTKQIAKMIKQLNDLGDQRDELMTSCPAFKERKAATTAATLACGDLYRLDPQILQEIGSKYQDARWIAKLTQIIERTNREYSNCVMPSPIAGLNYALSHCQETDDNDKVTKQNEALCSALIHFVLYNEIELLETITNFGSPTPTPYQLKLLKEQFPKAKERASEIHDKESKEKEGKIQTAKEKLIKNLEHYHKTRQVVLTDSNYAEYVTAKDLAYNALRELSSFCSLGELANHKKATNELSNKLYRICQVKEA